MADENVEALEGASSSNEGGAEAAEALAYEEEARHNGWLPEEEYPEELKARKPWVDAKTFVERGKRFTSNLIKEVETLKRQVADFEGTKAAFKKFHEETIKRKDAEIDEAIQELRAQRSAAIREGEDATAITLEDRIDVLKQSKQDLKTEVQQIVKPGEVPLNPAIEDWINDGNEWFREDPKLRAYAVEMGRELKAKGDTSSDRMFLGKIRKMMEAEFPSKFGNNLRNNAGSVEGGTRGGAGLGGKTEQNLPTEDRVLMDRFIKEKVMTKEQFLKSYFGRK
jgi:hypothetical protein